MPRPRVPEIKPRQGNIMNCHQRRVVSFLAKIGPVTASLALTFLFITKGQAQTTLGGNAQHTAAYTAPAQNLNAVHWTTSIDLNNSGGFAHYGAPVITPANTVFVPVKTGATS